MGSNYLQSHVMYLPIYWQMIPSPPPPVNTSTLSRKHQFHTEQLQLQQVGHSSELWPRKEYLFMVSCLAWQEGIYNNHLSQQMLLYFEQKIKV